MLEGAGGEFGNKLLQDVRVYSLALVLNVLFVLAIYEQITFES